MEIIQILFYLIKSILIDYDDRTTLNLGLGYRRLNADETWMTGFNVFYDHELSDNHKRNGVGFEVVSSVLESRAIFTMEQQDTLKIKVEQTPRLLMERYGL